MSDTEKREPAAEDPLAQRRREAWQARLLPLMMGVLIAAAAFFAVMSVFELRSFYDRVEQRPLALAPVFTEFEQHAAPASRADPAYLRFKTLALLEADALYRRYHQANATMLARVWTRQLGFVTGMVLALVGAAFVLGRLREDASRIEAELQGAKAAIASSSPGLVLAVLGTVLMGVTLAVPFGVETRDVATYISADVTLPAPGSPTPLLQMNPAPPASAALAPPDPGPPPALTGR